MSLKTSTKLEEANKFELEITVDGEVFKNAVNKVYKKQVKSINIPGFRKGKVPKKVLENAYGQGVFYEEAINYAFPKYYEEVLTIGNLQYSRHGCLCTEEFRDDLSVHPGSYATGLGRTIGKAIGCRG